MIGGENFKALFVEETKFYNRIVLGPILPPSVWDPLPHFLQTWLRSYIGTGLVYFVSGLAWSFVICYWKRNVYVPDGPSVSLSLFFRKLQLLSFCVDPAFMNADYFGLLKWCFLSPISCWNVGKSLRLIMCDKFLGGGTNGQRRILGAGPFCTLPNGVL